MPFQMAAGEDGPQDTGWSSMYREDLAEALCGHWTWGGQWTWKNMPTNQTDTAPDSRELCFPPWVFPKAILFSLTKRNKNCVLKNQESETVIFAKVKGIRKSRTTDGARLQKSVIARVSTPCWDSDPDHSEMPSRESSLELLIYARLDQNMFKPKHPVLAPWILKLPTTPSAYQYIPKAVYNHVFLFFLFLLMR